MSMTVYPITGAAQTLDMSDIRKASGAATSGTGGYPSTAGLGGNLEVTQDRSVTASGSTRVMIKAAITTPLQEPGTSAITGVGTITAHTVVTVPKVVLNQLFLEQAGAASQNTMTSLVWLLACLNALTSNKSADDLPTVAQSLPMIQGILGALPLNLASGTYGSAGGA